MKTQPKIIVITGAESTGKSTLTEMLANHFNAPFVPEIARQYVEKLNRRYTFEDVETIAKKQVGQLAQLKNSDSSYIFADTWLIVTKIWFELVFKKEPDWLFREIEKTKIDLFLVCNIDIPWIADPVRENGGEKRKFLHEKYMETISDFNFKYKIVSGQNEKRFANAVQFIKEWK